MSHQDPGYFRRKFPRRAFNRVIGVLSHGHYQITDAGEIGEGGLSFVLGTELKTGDEIVINFQIPGGGFASLRAEIRSVRVQEGRYLHGVSFRNALFSHKRQIRAFVSARGANESLIMAM